MLAVFLQGNARDVLKGLPSDFFHCAVTSPPYFGLRKYEGGEEIWDGDGKCEHEWGSVVKARDVRYRGVSSIVGSNCGTGWVGDDGGAWKGQLGNEPTPELYLSHLVQISREVKRVLRPDGVFWLNIGDSWAANRGYQVQQTKWRGMSGQDGMPSRVPDGCKSLDMVLIPSQLALALRADGWYVRSMVVWDKRNPMPESVNGWRWEQHRVSQCPKCKSYSSFYRRVCRVCGWRKLANRGETEKWRAETGQQEHNEDGSFRSDSFFVNCLGCPKCSPHGGYILRKGSWRPTDSYEFILMLTKTESYYCDREAVLEKGVYPAGESRRGGDGHKSLGTGSRTTKGLHSKEWVGNGGRNLRSVWSFPTKSFPGAHFAVYPPRLVELAVKSSVSEKGCCPSCGKPWTRVVSRRRLARPELSPDDIRYRPHVYHGAYADINGHGDTGYTESTTFGWLSTCSCPPSDPVSCRVLDPFSGAGTTALVCERLGLDSVSIDTSAEYIQLSKDRLAEDEQKRMDEFVQKARRDAKNTAKGT